MNIASSCRSIIACALSNGVPQRCAMVALIVGTALNAINQGDIILSGSAISWPKLLLTYCVPYLVCTYGSVSAMLGSPRKQESRLQK